MDFLQRRHVYATAQRASACGGPLCCRLAVSPTLRPVAAPFVDTPLVALAVLIPHAFDAFVVVAEVVLTAVLVALALDALPAGADIVALTVAVVAA
jgi:hypothetical protein